MVRKAGSGESGCGRALPLGAGLDEGPLLKCRPERGRLFGLCSQRTAQRRFQLLLIKPSHYDDDGYVIRWLRTLIPSNSLAAVYGIALDCAERRVLGPDVAIHIDPVIAAGFRLSLEGDDRRSFRWSICAPF
jgi:hypothetical protein